MLYAVCVLVGVAIGVILSFIFRRKSTDPPLGWIVFDPAVSENVPYLGLDKTSDLDIIRRKRYVTLQVFHMKDDSQK